MQGTKFRERGSLSRSLMLTLAPFSLSIRTADISLMRMKLTSLETTLDMYNDPLYLSS